MAGYDEAKAAIIARGGSVAGYAAYAEGGGGPRKSLWATLFGGGEDEDEDLAPRGRGGRTQMASAGMNDSDGGSRGFFSFFGGNASPAPEPAPTPAPAPLPPTGEAGPALTPMPPPVVAAPIAIPLPPRRPAELVALARDVPVKEPPARFTSAGPGQISPPVERRGEMRPPGRPALGAIGADDKAALKSLFASATTPAAPDAKARSSFSTTTAGGPRAGSFSGATAARSPRQR